MKLSIQDYYSDDDDFDPDLPRAEKIKKARKNISEKENEKSHKKALERANSK